MYDLEQRTSEFGKRIVRLVQALPNNQTNKILSGQCLRSGTSVGANYREANDATGTKDFLFRLKISRKESKETTHWLELIAEANPTLAPKMNNLLQESKELTYILSAIITKTRENNTNI